jgi:fatty acid-binding protein DegV
MEKYILVEAEKMETLITEMGKIRNLIEENKKEQFLKEWLSKQEGRQRLKVSLKTLDNYLKNGVIPYSRFAGKIYIQAKDIEAHLQRNYISA